MIRPPLIERLVQRLLVVEVAIAAVHRQGRRGDRREIRARRSPNDFMLLPRSKHDHLVPEPGRRPQLRFGIGANAATVGGIKGTYVNDPHRAVEAVKGRITSSELFVMRAATSGARAPRR